MRGWLRFTGGPSAALLAVLVVGAACGEPAATSPRPLADRCGEKIEGAKLNFAQRIFADTPFETAFRQYLSARPLGEFAQPLDMAVERLLPFAEATYLTDPLRPGYEPGGRTPRDWLSQHTLIGQPALAARMREVWKLSQQLGPRTDQGFANICSLTRPQIELMHTFLPYGEKGGVLNLEYGALQGNVNAYRTVVEPFLRTLASRFQKLGLAGQFERAFAQFNRDDPTGSFLDEIFRPDSVFAQVIPGLQSTPTPLPTATPLATPTTNLTTNRPMVQTPVGESRLTGHKPISR